MEGRQAPALFVVGWLATVVGVSVGVVAALGVTGVAGTILWLVALSLASVGLVLLGGSQAVERRAAGEPYAGPSPVLVFLAVVAISQLAGFVVGFPLSPVGGAIPRPVGDLIAVSVQALVFLGAIRVMVVGSGALTWGEMRPRPIDRRAVSELAIGVLYAFPVIVVTAVVAVVAVQLGGISPPSPLPPTGTPAGLILHLLAGAVVAPMAEEALFRGFALTAWRRSLGATPAIVRSSLLFVIAHVLFVGGDSFREAAALAFVGGVARIPIAFALGWLFVRTDSILAAFGLHAAFNGILIVLAEVAASAPHAG